MADVKKIGRRWYVVHGKTKAPLKRKGKLVGFASKKAARKEALATYHRVFG